MEGGGCRGFVYTAELCLVSRVVAGVVVVVLVA